MFVFLAVAAAHKASSNDVDEIIKELKRDGMMLRNDKEVLLLGVGEFGKSTVLKLIDHGGYNDLERDFYKETIFS